MPSASAVSKSVVSPLPEAVHASLVRQRIARGDSRVGALEIDQPAALIRVPLGQQALHRHAIEARIRIPPGQIRRRQPESAKLGHQSIGTAEPHLLEIEALEHVEHFQRGESLAIRRQLVDVVTTVIDRSRRHPFAVEIGEIQVGRTRTDPPEKIRHDVCDLALVESVAAPFCKERERVRKVRIAEDFPFARRVTVDQENLLRILKVLDQVAMFFECRPVPLPLFRDHLGDREAMCCVVDGGRQVFAHWQFAELLVQCEPGIDDARYRHLQRAEQRDLVGRLHAGRFAGGLDRGLHLFQRTPPWATVYTATLHPFADTNGVQ